MQVHNLMRYFSKITNKCVQFTSLLPLSWVRGLRNMKHLSPSFFVAGCPGEERCFNDLLTLEYFNVPLKLRIA